MGILPVSADPGVIYVNNATGNNSWDGQSPVYNATTGSGPKLSLKNATGIVNAGGTVHMANGVYTGSDNRNIVIDKEMAIIGQNKTGTIIDAQSLGRIFTISGGSLTLQNLTLKNGYADNGGAISNGASTLTVTDCTFINNTSTASGGGGGAILDNSAQTSTVSGCTFTNNTAIKYGGAIFKHYGGLIVSGCTFTGNTASQGAIYGYAATITANFNRFVGNNGYAVYCGTGSIVATNSWWGTNTPDLHVLTYGTVAIDPWIVLTITLDPESITNGTTQVKADLTRNSRNQDTSTEGHIPDGVPVTFTAENGTINPLSGVLVNGVATALFTAGGQGVCVVNATLDNTTVSTNVNRAPTIDHVGNKVVDENKLLTFNVVGHDQDGDTLTYVATDLPTGATFDQNTGLFTWKPSYSQAGTYQVTFKVYDCCSTTTETITITVNDVDNVAPTVTKIDPAKNAVVKTAKAIKITFNETVKNGSLLIDLKSSGKAVAFTTSISGNTLTITPKNTLTSGKYIIGLHTGAITDLTGNALALYSSSFTVDNTAPTMSKFDPANSATRVSPGKTIKITFNEAVKAGSLFVELKNSAGKAVSITKKVSGKVLTIDPKSNLPESLYTLTIHTGAVTDLVGNPVAGKSSKFSVGTAPVVSKVDPKNGATKVSRSKTIKVTFNEAIKAASGSKYWVELKTSSGKSVKITKSISGKVLSIGHAKLAANTKYKLTLHTGSVTDKAGNPIASKTYTFTTAKT